MPAWFRQFPLMGAYSNILILKTNNSTTHGLTIKDNLRWPDGHGHEVSEIGDHFAIDHGTGVVIGATSIIGNNVKLYQGVTLGAKSFPLDEEGKPIKGIPRHPILEDNVIVYSNATILGRITVGRDATVGGNIWVTEDVPPRSRIVQTKAKK